MKDLDFLRQETRPVSIKRHLFSQGAMLGVFISPLKVTLDDGLRIILKEALCIELLASLLWMGCFSDCGDKRPQGLLSSVDSLFSFCLLRGNSLRGYWRENICGR